MRVGVCFRKVMTRSSWRVGRVVADLVHRRVAGTADQVGDRAVRHPLAGPAPAGRYASPLPSPPPAPPPPSPRPAPPPPFPSPPLGPSALVSSSLGSVPPWSSSPPDSSLGSSDGSSEGSSLGSSLGSSDGSSLGSSLGSSDGSSLGSSEGSSLGSSEGSGASVVGGGEGGGT